MAKKIIYITSHDGTARKSGKPYFSVTLAEYDEATKQAVEQTFFSAARLAVLDTLHFGDFVKPYFEESSFFGGKPQFVNLEKVADSPY